MNVRRRFAISAALPAFATLAVMALVANRLARRALEDELGARLVTVAQAAAAALPAERVARLEPGDEGTRTYGHVRNKIDGLAQATSTRIVILKPDRTALADSAGRARIGEPIPAFEVDRLEIAQAAGGKAVPSQVLFEGEDGLPHKTGYAPLSEATGQPVAVVAAEGTATSFAALRGFRRLLFTFAVAGAVAGALVAALAAIGVTRPLLRLTEAAQRIARGDLRTPIWKRMRKDEIRTLRDTMEEMRLALRARDEERETLLAGIAHEVRNPLGGMDLFTGLLSEELAGRPEAAHVDRIRSELATLERVVEEFLDYARARPLELVPVDLALLAEEVKDLALPLARERGVEIAVDAAGAASGDREKLRRAVLNLVRNAIEASPRGGTTEIAARAGGGEAWIEVRDRGPGISPVAREKLFSPFFTTKEQGTGLGLALAKKAAEAHGGALRLDDRAGGGTVARISVPGATGEIPLTTVAALRDS